MNGRGLVGIAAAALLAAGAGYLLLAYSGAFGRLEDPGVVSPSPRPHTAAPDSDGSRILFGDLHVHTTYSIDAFQYSLAFMGGEGSHPPADACDFARFCSALDFFAYADHAEQLTPQHWRDIVETTRQCNRVAQPGEQTDLVVFPGWEWTHAGTRPDNHFGHKVVVLRDDRSVPARPIYAIQPLRAEREATPLQRLITPFLVPGDRQRMFDFNALNDEVLGTPLCETGVPSLQLPADCREGAASPRELFGKLDEWEMDAMVIPHGNAWGIYTPAGISWDKQLRDGNQRSDYQFLVEAFSGHGNSEQYKPWRAVQYNSRGEAVCPEPTRDYLPSCWRAGEIMRQRCLDSGEQAEACDKRASDTRGLYVKNGIAGHNAVPGTEVGDWLDSGQCRDCFLPAFNYRPGGSAQYALSLTEFDNAPPHQRFNFGLIASSDNHLARPGTGYKERFRYGMTEVNGVQNPSLHKLAYQRQKPLAEPQDVGILDVGPPRRYEHERGASFLYTGGLVAVHTNAKNRDGIWESLQLKQVYGTSGERILLWFDLLNGPQGSLPMGSELPLADQPRFRVRALGAYKQKPGCPDYASQGLGPQRLASVCRGECYNPSDQRKRITRIEVVRIRPQVHADEAIQLSDGSSRIEDPWQVHHCPADPDGCEIEFTDPQYLNSGRDTLYYVRAIQEPTAFINGGGLRCDFDSNGQCISVNPCYSDDRSDHSDDCLADAEGRAWSSPIFVNFPASETQGAQP